MLGKPEYAIKYFENMMRCVGALGSVLVLLFGIVTMSQAEEVIRLTNGEWPPFTSQKLKHDGVYSHIVSESFALEGVTVEYGFFPWKRSYIYVREGVWDGSVTWAPTPEKEKDVFFSTPVFLHTKVFFHLKSFPFAWNTINDLQKVQIGTTAEYTYGEEFDRAVKDGVIRVDSVTQDIQNLHKLFADRIQIFPTDIDVGYALLNANFSSDKIALVTYHGKPIQQTMTCAIFTKATSEKSQRLLKLFNRGLVKLKESGAYDRMLEASRRGEYQQK